jgi:hypothetical protein
MLRTVGGGGAVVLGLLAMLLIPVLFIQGGVWLSALIFPWLVGITPLPSS